LPVRRDLSVAGRGKASIGRMGAAERFFGVPDLMPESPMPVSLRLERKMELRDILVFVDDSASSDQRVDLAMAIARDHHASLDAVFLPARRDAGGQPGGSSMAALGRDSAPSANLSSSATQIESAERCFHDRRCALGIEGDWYVLEPRDVGKAVGLARTADLIVIGQADRGARRTAALNPADIVVACGQPVLVVPFAGQFPEIGRQALVAWDGTPEAARALNQAFPLIRNASAVTLVTIAGPRWEVSRGCPAISSVIRHLARHGIEARAEQLPRGDIGICDILLSRSADHGADLLIAGAFPHSKLRESLFGSVSRQLFRQMTIPVLMSH
jgi:nucleotide-binding universal stress UspA family protein